MRVLGEGWGLERYCSGGFQSAPSMFKSREVDNNHVVAVRQYQIRLPSGAPSRAVGSDDIVGADFNSPKCYATR
jgi:hypothetical protein